MDATAHAWGCPVAPCPINSPLTPFFLLCKEEAKKGGDGSGGGGSCGGLGGLVSHKELDVVQVGGGGDCVCPDGAVFSELKEEEEGDTDELCNSFVSWRAAFGDCVHAVEDGDSSGGRIFFLVCRKLLSQAKVDCPHVVESWVRNPHGCEDLSHRSDVLFHTSFVDGLVVGCKDSRADLVSEDL